MFDINNSERGISLLRAIYKRYHEASVVQLFVFALFMLFVTSMVLPVFDGVKAPFVGYRSILEPAFLVRLRFAKGALPQITEGYRKVS